MNRYPQSFRRPLLLLIVFQALLTAHVAPAADVLYIGPNLGDWNVNANWSSGFVPDASFGEVAIIDNNNTVLVASPVSDVGGVILGPTPANTGGLRIQSGGILRSVMGSAGSTTGALQIGVAGTGTLTIVGNGILSGTSLTLAGATNSSITLRDTARLSVLGTATLARHTTIGSHVILGADSLVLRSTSILTVDLGSATDPMPLRAGTVTLGGTLKVQFVGVTPTSNHFWKIFDATNYSGGFTKIMPAAPGPGLRWDGSMLNVNGTLRIAAAEPLRFDSPRLGGSTFEANLLGGDVTCYRIEVSSNLTDWRPIQILRGFGLRSFADPDAFSHDYRFYRAHSVSVTATLIADFETNALGREAMFRQPSFSGSTSGFIDTASGVADYAYATNNFPPGLGDTAALRVAWTFRSGTTNPWLRLTTFNAAAVPNPAIDFREAVTFDIHTDRDVYVTLGLRESNPTGSIASNGGTIGAIEWAGANMGNLSNPPLGRFVPGGQWMRLTFFIPFEPILAFTGNGVLESTTGLGALEHLAIVPAAGLGAYNMWLDNFAVIHFGP